MNKTLFYRLIIFILLSISINGYTQVTVGSDEKPANGSLLQLKNIKNADGDAANSTGGLGLPRVILSNKTELYPMFLKDPKDVSSGPNDEYSNDKTKVDKVHTGLVVYHMGNAVLDQGLYYWDGAKWAGTTAEAVAAAGPWQKVGTTSPSTLNTDDSYLSAKVVVGGSTVLKDHEATPNAASLSVYGNIQTKDGDMIVDGNLHTEGGDVYVDGNVGVGTESPKGALHIDGAKDNSATPTTAEQANDFVVTSTGSVGIGTLSPDASAALEIAATNKGFLGARVALTSITDQTTITAPAVGLMVYNTGAAALNIAGYFYWTGTVWEQLKMVEPWMVSGTTTTATSNTDDIYQKGHVAIGTDAAIEPTAILNVVATNKGVLLPRIALSGVTDIVTIPNPIAGLLIYNTGAHASFKTTGYMYWDGFQWKLFAMSSAETALAKLNCAGAGMSPSQQLVGGTPIIAGTVLQIPYTGSNGGSFNGATLTSIGNTNVTATISGGMLSVGNGMLNFALSGTPTIDQQAPNGIVFDLTNFLNANTGITGCNEVTVGNVLGASIEELATMGNFMLVTDNTGNDLGGKFYALQCNSPDGKFSIRAEVPSTTTSVAHGNQTLNIQVRNNQSAAVPVIWNFNTDYLAAISGAGVLTMPSQRWGGDRGTGNTWTSTTAAGLNVYWGQIGIYDAVNGGPEYRRYTWIPIGDSKVSYEATIMVALDTTTPLVAVHPTKIKCYIKFSQVTAQ